MLIAFDLDGTLKVPRSGETFPAGPTDQRPVYDELPSVLANLRKDGAAVVGITNQGGVGAGFKTMDQCLKELRITHETFRALQAIYFCPTDPEKTENGDECYKFTEFQVEEFRGKLSLFYRKPGPGMLGLAITEYGTEDGKCIYVGDRPEDKECAVSAGVPFIWAEDFHDKARAGKFSVAALACEYFHR